MMKSEKRSAPPTARAVSISSLPMKIWRKPPRMRTMSPVKRAACMLEKSRLVWNVKAVRPTTTAAVRKKACTTTAWSKKVTSTPAAVFSVSIKE